MKIWVFTVCRNEARILPYFLRHYTQFADRILVFDDKSTDGSRELITNNAKARLLEWPYDGGLDDEAFVRFAHATYPLARGQADWCMWVDCDEFIYHPKLHHQLYELARDVNVVRTQGYNMLAECFPHADTGRQIWQDFQMGTPAPIYSKPVVFRAHTDIRWDRGKHHVELMTGRITEFPLVKLLHYRYLGKDYIRERNANNYERCGLETNDKSAAWSCSTDWKGEGSPEWFDNAWKNAINVIETPL